MKNKLLSIIILLSMATIGYGDYSVRRYTIDGGGKSSGGKYIVTGTIAQPDAAYSESQQYELLGGFWAGEPSCFVDFEDFAMFADYWLQTGTNLPADLFGDNIVDHIDLDKFSEEWLCSCPYGWPLK